MQKSVVLANLRRIVDLLAQYALDVTLRHSHTGITHGNLYIAITLGALDCNHTTLGSEFGRVVHKRVHHEQRKCLIGLHHRRAIVDNKFNATSFEQRTALLHNAEDIRDREILDLQVEVTLAHLYPSFEHHIEFIESVGKFRYILQFSLCIGRRADSRQRIKFPYHAVHIRAHACNHRYRHALEQVLAFVLGKID